MSLRTVRGPSHIISYREGPLTTEGRKQPGNGGQGCRHSWVGSLWNTRTRHAGSLPGYGFETIFTIFLFLFKVTLSACNSQATPMLWCCLDVLSHLGLEWNMFNLTKGKPNLRVLILSIFPSLSLRSSTLIVGSPALPGCLARFTSLPQAGFWEVFSQSIMRALPALLWGVWEMCSPQHTFTHRGLGCHQVLTWGQGRGWEDWVTL